MVNCKSAPRIALQKVSEYLLLVLISREEMKFDFGGATFDLERPEERRLLAWVFNQFLYGEVTGIQCGHWLYHAPTLNAASFLAKQAGEELAHVRKILRVLSLLEEKPGPAHWAVRFLSTGMMGGSWGEHVALEMALGEGLVLSVFYALTDTLKNHPEIHKILETASVEEERHVEFGERETQAWLQARPSDRDRLLALAVVQSIALSALRGFVIRQVAKQVGPDHPVLKRFDAFYRHTLERFELRIERLGLADRPLSRISPFAKAWLVARIPLWALASKLRRRSPLLTQTYLSDPALEAESRRYSHPAS
jgi:hypothetical protein